MSNPYQVISIRGNPDRVRGMISQIRLLTGQARRRDGDILEDALVEYVKRIKHSKAVNPSVNPEALDDALVEYVKRVEEE